MTTPTHPKSIPARPRSAATHPKTTPAHPNPVCLP
jgi:hypothetical protein